MALASLFGGLALANAGLGMVQGFATPLGGQWKAPHGALCAALLPHGMAANVAGLRARAPRHLALERYSAIARLLTGRSEASVEDGIEWVRALSAELSIPALRAWGVTEVLGLYLERLLDRWRRSDAERALQIQRLEGSRPPWKAMHFEWV